MEIANTKRIVYSILVIIVNYPLRIYKLPFEYRRQNNQYSLRQLILKYTPFQNFWNS